MTSDTLPLWVETSGNADGPDGETFVLIHGYGGSSFSWRHWAPLLRTRGRVVLVDLKGFGRAPRPDDDLYAPTDLADLVARLVTERDLRDVTLVGHSLGGAVTLLAALGLRDAGEGARLRRLVLVAGAAYRQPLPPFVTLARHPGACRVAMRILGPEFVVAQALRAIVFDIASVTRDQVRGYAATMRDEGALRGLLRTAALIEPPDADAWAARYPELDLPVLLLWGRHDRAVPLWVGERLDRELPRATLAVLERCGHLPAEECPRASLARLTHFLEATRGE